MKIRVFLTAIATAIILIANFQPALAGSWVYHYSAIQVQATSYGGGGKRVSKISNALWLAEISSITTPAIAIPVGWTYWTSREVCNGSIKQQAIHPGRSVVQTSTYDYQYMNTMTCSSTRSGQVLGKHEVKGSIYIYRDDWTQSEYIP
ncbi:MAG: hypothetical protein HOP27_17375 [Anaerolineales bacterium]|jgi:hypothetical protein|nr:hypothetical protein [Anaerolineales bacterium]